MFDDYWQRFLEGRKYRGNFCCYICFLQPSTSTSFLLTLLLALCEDCPVSDR